MLEKKRQKHFYLMPIHPSPALLPTCLQEGLWAGGCPASVPPSQLPKQSALCWHGEQGPRLFISFRANRKASLQTSALICWLHNSKTKQVRDCEGGVCSKCAWEDSKTL